MDSKAPPPAGDTGVGGGIRGALRAARVYKFALQCYLSYRATRKRGKKLKKELGLDDDDPSSDYHPDVEALWAKENSRQARLVYDKIISLRGLWVKAGQFISSRPDIAAKEYVAELEKLQDAVPTRPWGEVESTLRQSLGADWQRHFRSVDREVLSSASIAQVHRAELADGTPVVLKVRHKGIKRRMKQDLLNLKILTDLLAYFEPDQDYRRIVDEWRPAVREELDLRNECKNLLAVAANMRKAGVEVIIPAPVERLCSQSVLVMNFCEGFSPKDDAQLDARGVDKSLFMRRLCQAFATQIHVDGHYHGDPHPGNILVSTAAGNPDVSVPVLLDFGLVKRFEPEMRVAFSKMVFSSFSQDLDQLAKSFKEMGLLISEQAQDPFRDMVNMRRLFRPTPKSQVKERRLELAQERAAKAKKEKAEAAERAARGEKEQEKVKRPVEAWPSELVFFIRVTGLLKGLCSSFDIEFPYLQVMAETALTTVRESFPEEVRATAPLYPGVGGADSALQTKLEAVVLEMRGAGRVEGLQCTVMKGGEVVADISAGTLSESDPRPVRPSTLFNVFSVTKAFLAAAVHILVERGQVALDDPVAKFWDGFAQEGKEEITVRQLLSHEAGLAQAMPRDGLDPMLDFDAMVRFVAGAKPQEEKVGAFEYHAISYCWLVGGLIQGATGQSLADFVRAEVLSPLGIEDDAHLGVPRAIVEGNERLASVCLPSLMRDSGSSQEGGSVFRQNPSVFNMDKVREAVIPSANAHMTSRAIAAFYDGLFGQAEGKTPILSSETKERILAQSRVLAPQGAGQLENSAGLTRRQGLGFQVFTFSSSGGNGDVGVPVIGHLGFGGSVGFTIPSESVSVGVAVNALDLSAKGSCSAALVTEIAAHFGLQPQQL